MADDYSKFKEADDYSSFTPVEDVPQQVSRETSPATQPQQPQQGYFSKLVQPAIQTEQALHQRGVTLSQLPMAAKVPGYINQLAGGVGDVISGAANTLNNATGGTLENLLRGPAQAINSGISTIGNLANKALPINDIVQGAGIMAQQHPIAAEYAKAIPNAAMLGVPGKAGLSTALEKGGQAAENTFTNAIVGELGLLKPLAKKLGSNMSEAKENLSGIIQKYNLSDVRGFNSASAKADALASGKTAQADNLVNNYAVKNPEVKFDISKDIFKDIRSNISDYVRPGEEKQALAVVNNIEESVLNRLSSNGYQPGKTVPIDQLVEVKRSLNPRFAKQSIADDPVKEKMYETAYLKMMDQINQKVPEAGALNKEARDIWLAKDAMEEAAGRNDKLTNTIFGTAIGAAGAAGIITHPQVALPIAAAATGAELLRRGVTQGRALSAGIAASRGVKTIGNLLK